MLLHAESKSPEFTGSWWWPLCKSRYCSQVSWAKLASWVNRLGHDCPAHGSFHVPSLRAMPALGLERYKHQPPCRPHILGWALRA